MKKATTEQIEKAVLILNDLDAEIEEVHELVPNQTHVVGLQIICQYRDRENPDEVKTLKIEHGDPIRLLDDGDIYREAAKPEDFPEIGDTNIYPV